LGRVSYVLRVVEEATSSLPRKPSGWIVGFAAIGFLAVCFFVALPVGIYGLRKYLIEAKEAEAEAALAAFASGLIRCGSAARPGGASLPPTARPVPADLSSISGMKYQSDPADWQDEAYVCAGFAPSAPQYVQFQWVRESSSAGLVRAVADLDGDATPDFTFEQEVSCPAPAQCALGAM